MTENVGILELVSRIARLKRQRAECVGDNQRKIDLDLLIRAYEEQLKDRQELSRT